MQKNNEIVIFETGDKQVKLPVNIENETVWLTQAQMVELFQRDVSVISRHIRNVFKENEVEEKSNLHFLQIPNSVLKQYILQGYAVNHNRIAQLGEVIKIMKRTQNELDSQQVLNVIQKYIKALELFEITSASRYCKTKISKNSTMNRIFPSINLTQINILHTYTYTEDGFIIESNRDIWTFC